ncbi:anthranilate synthase component I [Thermoanaerobacterium thermosaccharolyticum]|jgi:anthranilate synthase component I, non-proteobacterial lineages|uniref:anthranilate synthase component I n=1 Tax=Thermoanaerobacterium thermosaccharolyticum TaxID=1517 RepID=UPI0027A8AEE0|nr:anthranilate synthase component [Thermoanaerobacterium sp.]WHE07940.1 anthranilate synthase component I [Thermoanaerobacterium thermosaccharolyticum]
MLNLSREEFAELKDKKVVFPIYVEINGDELTPVSIFYNLKGKNKFLLESAESGKEWGRYSFIGSDPYLKIKSHGNLIEIEKEQRTIKHGKVLDYIKENIEQDYDRNSLKLPFTGGALGYAGYDIIRQYENLPSKNIDEIGIPDAYFMFYKEFICYDHFKHTVSVIYNVFSDDDETYDSIEKKLNLMIENIKNNVRSHELPPKSDVVSVESNFTLEEFCNIVEKAKEYIRNGDIFQVVPSQRLKIKTKSNPFDIYRRLRSTNPSPYMFYIDFEDFQLIGSSPESLVSVFGDKVTTNPIAGTRKRGKCEEEDLKLKEELLNDEKERAEHVMLVDLGRNDIGKVSEFGSVKLDRFMEVDFYSHVMHIVSKVSGILKKGLTAFDALIACLPAGTVSGAPKIRAMEIIDELENVSRSFYAGAVGYFSFNGNMDMCIAIRTLLLKNGMAFIQAGCGIVYDSNPESEYYETLNKAMALKEVL